MPSRHWHLQQPSEAVQEIQTAREPQGRCQGNKGVRHAAQVDWREGAGVADGRDLFSPCGHHYADDEQDAQAPPEEEAWGPMMMSWVG